MRKPKQQYKPLNDLSRSLTPFDPNHSLIVVIAQQRKLASSPLAASALVLNFGPVRRR